MKGSGQRELQRAEALRQEHAWSVEAQHSTGEGASVSAQPVIPGLVPGTQSWPLHGSCSEEEFSWGRPRNSYRVMGETRLSCPRTSHLTPFRSLPQCHLLRKASLTILSQRAPPTISFSPSLVCFMCLIVLLHVCLFLCCLASFPTQSSAPRRGLCLTCSRPNLST